jgi:hypothetical protein
LRGEKSAKAAVRVGARLSKKDHDEVSPLNAWPERRLDYGDRPVLLSCVAPEMGWSQVRRIEQGAAAVDRNHVVDGVAARVRVAQPDVYLLLAQVAAVAPCGEGR